MNQHNNNPADTLTPTELLSGLQALAGMLEEPVKRTQRLLDRLEGFAGRRILFTGSSPYYTSDLLGLLPTTAVAFHGDDYQDEPVDTLVIGRSDFDQQLIERALLADGGRNLRCIPQEAFLDELLFGWDWCHEDNLSYLEDLRTRHPGLDFALGELKALQEMSTSVAWPSTATPESAHLHLVPGTGNGPEWAERSELFKLGYSVRKGVSRKRRWEVLEEIVIPALGIQATVNHIAFLVRNAKGRQDATTSYARAIAEWEHDLAQLQATYGGNIRSA